MLYNTFLHNFDDAEHTIGHPKAHITASEGHAIDAAVIIMVWGPRILCQHLSQTHQLLWSEAPGQRIGNHYVEHLPLSGIDKTAAGVRMAIGVGHLGLDVVDGRAIHQVSAANMYHGAFIGGQLHLIYIYAREAEPVRTEWRPRGKHANAGVTTQARRPQGERRSPFNHSAIVDFASIQRLLCW